MAPFVEEGNPLVEEEDCIVVELVPVSESLTDLRLEEVTSTIAPTPRSFGEKDAGICKPPVTRFHLILMEEHISPPSIDICHELLFDPKVKMRMQHFQIHSPKSIKSSEEYWRALQCELDMISDPKLCSVHPATLLPHLLEEIKSMLLYLYPDSKMINEQLFSDMDIPFVVQQLQLGNMCSSELAALFGAILKANCAPKRDGMIDHMILLGSEGNWIGMFKLCLELMEYMKLVRFHPR